MKLMPPLFLIAAFTLLCGCSSMKVTSEKVANFDFASVKTYEWVQAPEKILNEEDTYVNEQVLTAMNNQFAAREWQEVNESSQADIQVVYYIKQAEHKEYTESVSNEESRLTGGFTYDKSKDGWGYHDQSPDLNVYTIEVGTLTVLLYDAHTGEKIWIGTLKTRLDRTAPLERQQRMMRRVAAKMIHQIPGQ
jgi:hypothetical protein